MFNKTKRRIVFTVVISLLALLTVTLSVIYISESVSLRSANEEALNTYIERFSIEGQYFGPIPNDKLPRIPEGNPLMPERREQMFQLSTFYAVVYSNKSDEAVFVQNGNNEFRSEEELLNVSKSILESGKQNGSYKNMTFAVKEQNEYTLVAMIDSTMTNNNLSSLMVRMLIFGGIAFVVLFVAAIFIARRIVKPLEENDVRQKRFVSDAGHELKTPIAVISANSELLKREIGESEWLNNIDYENERMSELVKELLFLSKAENGDLPKEILDYSKLVDGEVLPFESLAFEKGVRIDSDIESGLTVKGNSNQLRQVVSILLDNALSHGKGDSIGLTLKHERRNAVLTVSNDSEEMTEEQLSHLFERFYRTDESRNESGSHYGLGLSIAKAVTEAHGGTIRAEYKNGKAIFVLSVPVIKE